MTFSQRALQGLAVALGWLAMTTASAAAPQDALRVMIKDFMFTPAQLAAPVGTEVTWVNQDDEPHTVVSETGLFRSAALDTGMTYSFRFDKAGTYHVFCSMHPQMVATIIVR